MCFHFFENNPITQILYTPGKTWHLTLKLRFLPLEKWRGEWERPKCHVLI